MVKKKEPSKPKKEPKELTRKQKYLKYLQSADWKERRDAFRETFQNKCMVCGSEENLQIHHLNYDNVGNEKLRDVACLCNACHVDIHHKRLYLWYFTEEESEYFKKIKHVVCNDPYASYFTFIYKTLED